jgi:hypothetical protein
MPNGGPVIKNANVSLNVRYGYWEIFEGEKPAISVPSEQVRSVEHDGKLYFFWKDTDADLEFRMENMGLQLSVKDDDREKARKMRFIIDQYLNGDGVSYKEFVGGENAPKISFTNIPVNFSDRIFFC